MVENSRFRVLLTGVIAIVVTWPFAVKASEPQIILAESFESIPSGGYVSGELISGWRVTGSVEVHTHPYGITGPAHTGAKVLEVNGSAPGAVSTNLPTVAGKQYSFSFVFTKNPEIGTARAAILVNTSLIAAITSTQANSYSSLNWQTGSVSFQATSSNSVLTLEGLETGNAGVYFDSLDVRLRRVGMEAHVNAKPVTTDEVYARGEARILLQSALFDGLILYTLDGSGPETNGTLYLGEFSAKRSARVRAVAFNSDFSDSEHLDPFDLFVLPELIVSTDGGGSVAIDPEEGAYHANSTASLAATAESGWSFLNWMGDLRSNDPGTTLTVTNDVCVTAVFATGISNSVIGSGLVHLNPAASLYPYGTRVQATAVPQAGSFFVQWGGDVSGTNSAISLTMTNANPRLTALFAVLPSSFYSLAAVPLGEGRVSLSPIANRYMLGSDVTLTAVPEPSQTFIGWTGDASGTTNPLVVSMTRNKIIYANFSHKPALALRPCGRTMQSTPFRMVVHGSLTDVIELQQSADVLSWQPMFVMTNTTGRIEVLDEAINPKRFYRAELLAQ